MLGYRKPSSRRYRTAMYISGLRPSTTSVRIALCAIALASIVRVVPQTAAAPDIEEILSRVGERVRQYFQRAQSLIATETVRLQPSGVEFGLSPSTRPRRLVYELRLAWDAAPPGEAPDANIVRKLLTVDGRLPRPKDE